MNTWKGIKNIITYLQSNEPNNPDIGDVWVRPGETEKLIWVGNFWHCQITKNGWGPGSDYGFFCGSGDTPYYSMIDRITFPFDSGTAVHVGDLTKSGDCDQGGCNSSNYGYITGISESNNTNFSTIDRITFPFDSGTATHIGNLTGTRGNSSNCNSSNYGFINGGHEGTNILSNIERIVFPFDSGTASHVGNLSGTRSFHVSCNSSTHGFINGGSEGSNVLSIIDRIAFPFNSGTASHVGNLSATRQEEASCNSSNYGHICGGKDNSATFSTVDRITFPFNSGTASHSGNLTGTKLDCSGCNGSNYGYIAGGGFFSGTSKISTIDRLIFIFNSGTAIHTGNLSGTRREAAGVDGTDFVNLFNN